MADEQRVWTLEALKEHLEKVLAANKAQIETLVAINDEKYGTRFDAMEKATQAALKSAEQAVLKAEAAAERRFDAVNEFRATLSDQQRNLMPRQETTAIVDAVKQEVHAVDVAISGRVNGLEKQLDAIISERVGARGGYGFAVGVVGFVLTIVAIIMMVFKVTP
jgi:hypothetical protein